MKSAPRVLPKFTRGIKAMLVVVTLMSCAARAATPIIPAPPQLAATGYLLIDADTCYVIVEHNSE